MELAPLLSAKKELSEGESLADQLQVDQDLPANECQTPYWLGGSQIFHVLARLFFKFVTGRLHYMATCKLVCTSSTTDYGSFQLAVITITITITVTVTITIIKAQLKSFCLLSTSGKPIRPVLQNMRDVGVMKMTLLDQLK